MVRHIDQNKLEIQLNKILSTTRMICILLVVAFGSALIIQTQIPDPSGNPVTIFSAFTLISAFTLLIFVEFIWRRTILRYGKHIKRLHYFIDEEI